MIRLFIWSKVRPTGNNVTVTFVGSYAGRPVSPSTATGNKKTHMREARNFLAEALGTH